MSVPDEVLLGYIDSVVLAHAEQAPEINGENDQLIPADDLSEALETLQNEQAVRIGGKPQDEKRPVWAPVAQALTGAAARRKLVQVLRRMTAEADGPAGAMDAQFWAHVGAGGDAETPPSLRDIYLTLPLSNDTTDASPDVPGLRTALFAYQRRSLARMVARERNHSLVLEPTFWRARPAASDGPWLCVKDWSWHREPRRWSSCAGGILCEDMGTGKTCVCLALILSSLGKPPPLPFDAAIELEGAASDGIQTLKTRALRAIAEHGVPWRRMRHSLPQRVKRALKSARPFFWRHAGRQRPALKAHMFAATPRGSAGERVAVYPTPCTLVIVPDNLVDQWAFEIGKHCEPSALKYAVVPASAPLPGVRDLFKLDLVVLSQTRLARERAATESFESPLARMHWQRLIVDEGHVYNAQFSSHALAASRLSAAFRWVCSGTPTPLVLAEAADRRALRSDLLRLRRLCESFLQCPLIRHRPSAFNDYFVRPYLDADSGMPPGAAALQRFLDSVMVRSPRGAIASEVCLPPLIERVQRLPLTRPQRLAYNTLLAFFKVNAVTSEREGVDYFFHPSNRESLTRLLHNLADTLLWLGGVFSRSRVTELVSNARAALLRLQGDSGVSTLDTVDLAASIHWAEQLLSSLPLDAAALSDSGDGELMFCASGGFPASDENLDVADGLEVSSAKADSQLENWLSVASVFALYDKLVAAPPMATNAENNPQLLASLSTRFNYLLNRLVQHERDGEKTIVYCQSPPEVFYVSLICCLANLRHLIYTRNAAATGGETAAAQARMGGRASMREKSARLVTFNTSSAVSVFVMEAQAAAYGVNLCAASRIYFCSPLPHDAMYRQAVKRAHRIGCVRPVHVETLCAADSFEEGLLLPCHGLGASASGGATLEASPAGGRALRTVVDSLRQRVIAGARFLPDKATSVDPEVAVLARGFTYAVPVVPPRHLEAESGGLAVDAGEPADNDRIATQSMQLTRALLRTITGELKPGSQGESSADASDAASPRKRKRKSAISVPSSELHASSVRPSPPSGTKIPPKGPSLEDHLWSLMAAHEASVQALGPSLPLRHPLGVTNDALIVD